MSSPITKHYITSIQKEKIMPVTIRRATPEEMKAHENEVIIFASRHPNFMHKSSNPNTPYPKKKDSSETPQAK